MPEMTLNLPVALGLMFLFLLIGAAVVFAILSSTGRVTEPTATVTPTATGTLEFTPTPSLTPTPEPTFTLLPPQPYLVQPNDSCSSIAATFKVSVQSIILLNKLSADCTNLIAGNQILVPQPTPTSSPLPTSTLGGAEATEAACEKVEYMVQPGDTISGISRAYNVSIDVIKEWNGLTSDVVFEGMPLVIPLCRRAATPGATPTPTLPPPYPAANLLLPVNGTAFMAINDVITLQWASVGTLRDNERYAVTVEDVTDGTGRKLTEYVTDTKWIVPESFRPTGNIPHIIRWQVIPVRQSGSSKEGEPIWEPAGESSEARVFSWMGAGISSPTP